MTDGNISLKDHFDELIAEQKKHYEHILSERDARYAERDVANKDAVRAALAAAEKAVAAALAAAEKAVDAALSASKEDANKTAESLKEYKASANEWRSTVQSLVDRMPSNVEVDRRFQELAAKVDDLRVSRDTGSGKSSGIDVGWKILLGVVALLGGIAGLFAFLMKFAGGTVAGG